MSIFSKRAVEPAPGPVPVPVPPKPTIDVELTNLITPPKPRAKGKLPPEAFNYWVGLGDKRTFTAVALEYGCSASAVAKASVRNRWQQRLELERPERIQATTREVQLRVRQKVGDLVSVDPAGDAEKARRVKNELLTTGLELLELGKKHLELVALAEPKDVMRCIELGAKLMQAATENEADKNGSDLVLVMRQKLAALTGTTPPEIKDAEIAEKENDNG